MLEAGMVLHLRVHRGGLLRSLLVRRRGRVPVLIPFLATLVIFIVVPSTALVCKVLRALVLVRAAIVLEAADDLVDV
jgi:hypothetical protein